MNISAGIAAELAMTRQAIAMSVIKQSAEMQQKMADILTQAVETVPVSPSRGGNVNISV